jgi:hypothetical protein
MVRLFVCYHAIIGFTMYEIIVVSFGLVIEFNGLAFLLNTHLARGTET